ncbi:MAG: acyltransferase [Lachnospiraceae bacterium]|nr:acyltransferase [Lachnospiraceae bacterium]
MQLLSILRFLLRHPSNEDFIQLLTKKGISVGKGTKFFAPLTNQIDTNRPWMISIGEYCKITAGVRILQHDYSRSVLRRAYGEVVPDSAPTIIGDNVFIGMNSLILSGSHIGNNVIIGAGSVVTGSTIPDNVVAAGNPCRVICTLEEHYQKRKKACVNEGIQQAIRFYKSYDRWPTIKEMDSFFPLYLERNRNTLEQSGVNIHLSGDDTEEIISDFLKTTPVFASYESFLEACKKEMQQKI